MEEKICGIYGIIYGIIYKIRSLHSVHFLMKASKKVRDSPHNATILHIGDILWRLYTFSLHLDVLVLHLCLLNFVRIVLISRLKAPFRI